MDIKKTEPRKVVGPGFSSLWHSGETSLLDPLCPYYFAAAVALLRVSEPNYFLPEMSEVPVTSMGLAFHGSTAPSSPVCPQQETSLCNKMTTPGSILVPMAVAKG